MLWWSGSLRAEAAAAAAIALLCLGACGREPPVVERVMPVFGTLVRVEIAGGNPAAAHAALDQLEALYRRIDVDWRAFGPGELGRVNARLAAGQAATLSPELARMVARSLEIRERSGGLFDPRVGPLLHLWGFDDLAHRTPATIPDDASIDTLRATALGAAELRLDGLQLSTTAAVTLDLASVAKGSALVAGAAALRTAGIRDALIVAGGDVLALGSRGQRPWRVGVRDPLGPGLLGHVDLADGEAAVSSGTYERHFDAGGRRFHHIIDPRSGRPAQGAAGSTVIGRDPELANAAATTLLVGGPESFDDLTRRLGLSCALLVATDGRRLLTPCMQQRLRP
ncbi:MAG: hypothetical protein AMXMBFR45_04180 [Gammaproteobacteria bacterium]|nr:FAD:protein FMN transferase [Gammaproteobacteria bacterium PRO8]GIK35313.1 MAG: FAD:protein FMN transferase [Gammaproteobacteria bacterium]